MGRRKVPPGVKEAVVGLALEGAVPKREIARRFGLDVQTVRRWAAEVKDIDPVSVSQIKQALPNLLTLLASAHVNKALEKIDDPNASVRHTFGAKLAVEAGRVAQPGAEAPGAVVLNFINQLKVHAAPQPEVIDAAPVGELAEFTGPDGGPVDAPYGPGDLAGPDAPAVEPPGAALALVAGDGGPQPDGAGAELHELHPLG